MTVFKSWLVLYQKLLSSRLQLPVASPPSFVTSLLWSSVKKSVPSSSKEGLIAA